MIDDLSAVLCDLAERLERRPSGELAVGGVALGVADEIADDVERLRNHLYRHYYLTGGRPARANGTPLSMWRSGATHSGYADSGATTLRVEVLETNGASALVREPISHLRLRASTNQLQSSGGVTTAPLAAVRPHLSPGFTVYDSVPPMSETGAIWRVYLNADPSMIGGVVEALSAALRTCPPYRFKAYAGSELRADSVVLYVSAEDYFAVRRALKRASLFDQGALREWVPLFTRAIAPGIAVAEDPGGPFSFGENRCDCVARVLLTLLGTRRRLARSDWPRLSATLAANGFDIERPYRTMAPVHIGGFRAVRRPDIASNLTAEEALESCVDAILESSITAGGKLTWLSRAGGLNVLSAARADVYSGTAGIGWFLAEAAAWRGLDQDGVAERLCSQAVEAAAEFPAETRHSLFSGPVGTALAVQRAAHCLRSESLADRARALAEATVAGLPAASAATATDWLGGLAGAAAGLLQAWRLWGLEEARDATVSIANEIASRARHLATGSAWPMPKSPRFRPLTGFSHGAGGVGLSLLMVGQELGRSDLIELAARAFAFENNAYSRAHRAWPDLRPGQGGFPKAWCHGSPGILLSHSVAHRLAPEVAPWDDRHRSAVQAMLTSISASTCSGVEPCLCHGYIGNLEIAALLAGRGLAAPMPVPPQLASQVLQDIARLSRGSPVLRDSSLMLGVAGIGMFILRRLLRRDGPSPLLLGVPEPVESHISRPMRNPFPDAAR